MNKKCLVSLFFLMTAAFCLSAQATIATSNEISEAPEVILGKGNYFTGEVIVADDSQIFTTNEKNVFVWLKDNKAVEVKLLKPEIFHKMLAGEEGHKVYDQWPMILKIKNKEYLCFYFATSGGGYYGLPNGKLMKERGMKQAGVVRSQWLTDKEGVKETNSLRSLIQQISGTTEQ